MKRGITLGVIVSLVFLCGVVVGYIATMESLFPMAHGYIFTAAPNPMPYGNDSPATTAHLSLEHDMSLLRAQTWQYVLTVTDASGQRIGGAVFPQEKIGGMYSLEREGKLTWDDDAWGVKASIGDFTYYCRLDRGK